MIESVVLRGKFLSHPLVVFQPRKSIPPAPSTEENGCRIKTILENLFPVHSRPRSIPYISDVSVVALQHQDHGAGSCDMGFEPRALNRGEKEMFDYIVDLLNRDMIIVEDYRSLGFDGDADLDDDMEWSDGPV